MKAGDECQSPRKQWQQQQLQQEMRHQEEESQRLSHADRNSRRTHILPVTSNAGDEAARIETASQGKRERETLVLMERQRKGLRVWRR